MTNFIMTCRQCSSIFLGACASFNSALVRSGNEFHTAQAVFLPRPTNNDNQLMHRTYRIRKVRVISLVLDELLFCVLPIDRVSEILPSTNASQTSNLTGCVSTTITANTTTSVSTVLTMQWCPYCAACIYVVNAP